MKGLYFKPKNFLCTDKKMTATELVNDVPGVSQLQSLQTGTRKDKEEL